MKRRVDIRKVAESAGVSITTVSHALNGKGRVSISTREHVRVIAEQLGYRPLASARNLVGGKAGVLGLAVSQGGSVWFGLTEFAYFVELMAAATETALERGYALVLVPGAAGSADPFERLDVDGAIIVDPVRADPLVQRMRSRDIPFVTTGRVPEEPDQEYWVDNDHVGGALAMLNHLERAGAHRVALLASPQSTSYILDTIAAYARWCDERGEEQLIALAGGTLTEADGYSAADDLLGRPDRPDAIYAALDRLALGALLAAEARRIVVPDDLLVAAGTDSEVARVARPPLTARSLNPREIGSQAVDMLADLVDGRAPAEKRVMIATRVIRRTSTGRRVKVVQAGPA